MKDALIDLIVDRKELYILRDGKLDYILVRVEKWTSMDVLNLQLGVMSIQELGREFGVKVCFHGSVDRQRILPKGSVKDVENHVREIVEAFGKFNGGYIGGGEVGADVPLENVEAMLRTFWSYRYT